MSSQVPAEERRGVVKKSCMSLQGFHCCGILYCEDMNFIVIYYIDFFDVSVM